LALADSALLSQPSEMRILSISSAVSNVFQKKSKVFQNTAKTEHLLTKNSDLYLKGAALL